MSVVAAAFLAGACETVPQATVSHIDPNTAVTVISMGEPLRFSGPTVVPGAGGTLDIALGPLEFDEMGTRSYYLWLGLSDQAADEPPGVRLLESGQVLLERKAESGRSSAPVSAAPYPLPTPWSRQYYYLLTPEDLKRLYGHHTLTLELSSSEGHWQQFDGWATRSEHLDRFIGKALGLN